MKKLCSLLVLALVSISVMAQTSNKIVIPNAGEYLVLKGDFHIHTVFSDGHVWPSTRVHEAKWEGLDFITITDHLDTRSRKMVNEGYFTEKCDRNTSYKMAKKAAKGSDLIVIHGGEISRGMPPGHFNCIFVKDNDAICAAAEKNDHDHVLAMEGGLREARKQGAFLMWNHPHWYRHAPNKTIMWSAHKKILKEGLMDAIEVYNAECGYSPEAHEWCLKHNLAIIGASDSHHPFFTKVDYANGRHRVVTLVFAKERSQSGIREAIDDCRTAIFADGMVYGRNEELSLLFHGCVEVKNVRFTQKSVTLTLVNNSSIPIRLTKAPNSEKYDYFRWVDLPPHHSINMMVRVPKRNGKSSVLDESVQEIDLDFLVDNFHVGADKPLRTTIKLAR